MFHVEHYMHSDEKAKILRISRVHTGMQKSIFEQVVTVRQRNSKEHADSQPDNY
jgi:hypothetical protein